MPDYYNNPDSQDTVRDPAMLIQPGAFDHIALQDVVRFAAAHGLEIVQHGSKVMLRRREDVGTTTRFVGGGGAGGIPENSGGGYGGRVGESFSVEYGALKLGESEHPREES